MIFSCFQSQTVNVKSGLLPTVAIRVPERLKSANAYACSVPPGNKTKQSVSHHIVRDQQNIPIYQSYQLLGFINGTYNLEIRILKIQINKKKGK